VATPSDDILARLIDVAVNTRPDASGRIRLPTERELAAQLSVQRPTLRDRLTVLETLGFIRRQQGSGTYLSLPNSRFLQFYFEVALKLGFLSIDQIQAALELIGAEMAAAAAIHAGEDNFAALDRVLGELQSADELAAFVEGQFEFHAELARASRNPVLVIVMDALASVIRQVLAGRVSMLAMVDGAFVRNVDAYAALAQAIRDREPELSRAAMQECYALWRREASKISMLYLSE
jgi:GntR family transcriptional regulator, transcriptional repressor for pyruvate dehydrogenase complex